MVAAIVLEKIKTQELAGGASRRQPILGFYVLVQLATAILGDRLFDTESIRFVG